MCQLDPGAEDRFNDLASADPAGTETRYREAENALSLETVWPYHCGLELKTKIVRSQLLETSCKNGFLNIVLWETAASTSF